MITVVHGKLINHVYSTIKGFLNRFRSIPNYKAIINKSLNIFARAYINMFVLQYLTIYHQEAKIKTKNKKQKLTM